MTNQYIYKFMADRVAADTSYNFEKLFSKFWFLLYYLLGYPLRVVGMALDGFVIYGLVYAARGVNWQAWSIAILGAGLIQLMLGLSTTVTAKNLFRGLLFRSVAYAMMFVITAFFAGGSLYSTLYLSKKGSAYAVEAVSPTLQQQSIADDKVYNDNRIADLQSKQQEELQTLKAENVKAQKQLSTQIADIKKTIKNYEKKVDRYAEGEEIPWELREPIIKGNRQLDALSTQLANIVTEHQKAAVNLRKQHQTHLTLVEQTKQTDIANTQTINQRKSQKLEVYGMIAIGGNVGINIISFLIILGYELYLRFAESKDKNLKAPRGKRYKRKNNPTQNTAIPTANSSNLTQSLVVVDTEESKSAETQVPQGTQPTMNFIDKSLVPLATTVTIPIKTEYFPYTKHTKNARINFRRAFQKAKDPQTTINRIKKSEEHINALLEHGFKVVQDSKERSRLHIDSLDTPTLEKGRVVSKINVNKKDEPVLTLTPRI